VEIRNIRQVITFKTKLKKHLANSHRTLYWTDRMRNNFILYNLSYIHFC
jgi:hypothetical protein